MKSLLMLLLLLIVALAIGTAFVWSGVYNIAADSPHWPITENTLTILRNRSILSRAADIQPPNLEDPALIRSGAGNYDAMCATCHLKPGKTDSELHRGLYPQPPNFAERSFSDPAAAFWAIKHGIKASAMPAWGKSMEDSYIWGMVAFVRRLPELTPEQYQTEVAASGGHHHGGGEDHHDHAEGHEHADADADHGADDHHDHDESASAAPISLEGLQGGAAPAAEHAAQAFQDALKRGDRAAALDLLAPQVRITEDGATQDLDDYASAHLGADMAFLKEARITLKSRASALTGDTAKVVSISEIHSTSKGKPLALESREAMELERNGEHWWITAIRWESAALDEHAH